MNFRPSISFRPVQQEWVQPAAQDFDRISRAGQSFRLFDHAWIVAKMVAGENDDFFRFHKRFRAATETAPAAALARWRNCKPWRQRSNVASQAL